VVLSWNTVWTPMSRY